MKKAIVISLVVLPGEVIGFVPDADGKFGSLNFNGVTFTKVAN